MLNFAYTNQTNFRPFSYKEMLAPVLMATKAHQAVEEAYSELDSQANAIGSLANEANDPVTYQRYKAYEESLRQQADALAKNGLTPGSRQSLLDLKGRYAKDITPIKNAITRRRELADEQRKALLQNPTLMFQRDMNSMSYDSSLDRFLENPDYDYGERYSGALLTKQVSQAASSLAKELTNYGNGKRLDAYTKTFLQQHGFTRDQVLDAISNPNRAQSQPVLNAIVGQVMDSSGMSNWADKPTMDKAYNYARQGLWSAIGQTNISTYGDYGAKLAAQEAMQKRVKDYENSQRIVKNLAINPLNIYSSRELSKEENEYNANVKNFSKYFYRGSDGKMRLTTEGLAEYRRNATPRVSTSTSGGGTARLMNAETQMQRTNRFTPTAFKKFLDSIGGSMRMEEGARWNSGRIGGLWENYTANSPVARTARYDATKFTEFDYAIDSTQQGDMKNSIMTASRGTTLKEVDFDGKTKQFKNTGDELKMEDLNSDNYHVVATRFSPYGNTVMIRTSDGSVKRYRMPSGINTTNESNRDRSMQSALQWQSIVTTGKYTDASGRVRQATAEEIRQAQDNYAAALQEAYLYHSQLGVLNKTSEQTFNPYGY